MVPWIQVYSNLPSHPKTARLAEELNIKSASADTRAVAAGMVVSLWCWAIQNAWSGDLSGCSDRAIADACLWRGKAEKLVSALTAAGFLDPGRRIHDWEDYALLQLENEAQRRRKTKERVARFRAERKSKKAAEEASIEAPEETPVAPALTGREAALAALRATDVTECNASTEQQQNKTEKSFYDRYVERLRNYDEPTARMKTREFFSKYGGRSATEGDLEESLFYLSRGTSTELMEYAFRMANRAGKPGNWNYIRGVLSNLMSEGIETVEQAEDASDDRASRL